MISKTKFLISNETIKALFRKANIHNITSISPLGAGEFNAVYEIKADKNYVLKIAPNSKTPVLRYEKDMLKAEIYWYKQIRNNTDIRVPDIYFEDDSKELIPADWFIMERIDGKQLDKTDIDKNIITRETAKMLAQIHGIHNDQFGYIQNEMFNNWYEALCCIIQNLLTDCEEAGKKSKNGAKLLSFAHKYRNILTAVPCSMVNYDLWAPNILCSTDSIGKTEFTWIDPERSFWGDRIFDFVCLENPVGLLGSKKRSIEYYNNVSSDPIEINRETEIRFAFALGLLALIQEVEKYYRYTPANFGWWRNIAGHIVYYKQAFRVLNNG